MDFNDGHYNVPSSDCAVVGGSVIVWPGMGHNLSALQQRLVAFVVALRQFLDIGTFFLGYSKVYIEYDMCLQLRYQEICNLQHYQFQKQYFVILPGFIT